MPTELSTPNPPMIWQRSSACVGENNCVEVAVNPDGSVAVRNSQRPGHVLVIEPAAWRRFVEMIRSAG